MKMYEVVVILSETDYGCAYIIADTPMAAKAEAKERYERWGYDVERCICEQIDDKEV